MSQLLHSMSRPTKVVGTKIPMRRKSSAVRLIRDNTLRADWLTGGGEMGRLIRERDWSRTPVGPVDTWPQSLKTAVSISLGSRHPIVIWWGKQALTQFYNDGYISFLGATKHPAALGQSATECWKEIWHVIEPMLEVCSRLERPHGRRTSSYSSTATCRARKAISPFLIAPFGTIPARSAFANDRRRSWPQPRFIDITRI